jgi:hypothetical protein
MFTPLESMFINYFDKKFSLFLLCFGIPLLFLPKYNLINLSEGETAGIRVDDIALLLIAFVVMWAHFVLNKKILKTEGWIFLITGFSLLSFLSNQILVKADVLHIPAKIFYVVRLLEYFFFFYLGLMASRLSAGDSIVKLFFLWNLLLMVLQKLGLTGAIASQGYHEEASSRVFGVASFPSEMGLILNLLFCYLIYSEHPSKLLYFFSPPMRRILNKIYIPLLFLLFGVFIVFTGNRISILALFICFLFKFREAFNWRSLGSLIGVSIASVLLCTGIFFVISNTQSVYERSASLMSGNNFDLVGIVWDKIDLKGDPLNQEGDTALEGYDMSWWIRIHKWLFMVKCFALHPECYLQGLGPGFAGAALDGGLLRILTEYGIVGTFLFMKFFGSLYRINKQTQWMIIAFMLNMIFFDAYLAYKAMSVLFFITGHLKGALREEQKLAFPSYVT